MKKLFKPLANWLDLIFLIPGMGFITLGAFQIYNPAGFIVLGLHLMMLAFFIARKQTAGR